jgi:hypothetical protein
VNDITSYTPYGARSYDENRVYQEFFSEHGAGLSTYVFLLAKDNGTMLRLDYLNEAVEVKRARGQIEKR